MFAGAVLNGLNNQKNLEESSKFGCFAASRIVQKNGPRLSKKEYEEIKRTFTSIDGYRNKFWQVFRKKFSHN